MFPTVGAFSSLANVSRFIQERPLEGWPRHPELRDLGESVPGRRLVRPLFHGLCESLRPHFSSLSRWKVRLWQQNSDICGAAALRQARSNQRLGHSAVVGPACAWGLCTEAFMFVPPHVWVVGRGVHCHSQNQGNWGLEKESRDQDPVSP